MIRQDKITFLISTLESPELYYSLKCVEYVHDNDFYVEGYSERVFKRIGIISKIDDNPSKILTKYLPVNKHKFLKKSLLQFSKDYCLDDNPLCRGCCFDSCCDYYNKKNDWVE